MFIKPRPRSGEADLGNNDARLSVCRQWRICDACTKTTKPIDVKIVDYRMQCFDVILNARWRTAANMKKIMSAYLSGNDPNMINFGALNQIGTMIEMI